MTETVATAITEEQKAEWNALHDQMRALSEASRDAQREAGATLAWGISNPGSKDFAMKTALAEAQRAVELWSERMALSERLEVHPYTAVVRARIAERKAAEVSR